MRTAVAIVTGIAIGLVAAGAIYVAVQPPRAEQLARFGAASPSPATPSEGPADAVDAGSAAARSQVVDRARPATRPSRPVPVTPDYGPPAEATKPIYRCRSSSGTTYSNEPCAGASVVAAASAVDGYDSRPSDQLTRLVANGRGAVDGGIGSSAPAVVMPLRESVECANYRRQIRDIDAASLRPNSLETLDEWRRIRQDIRTSMARSHC